MEGKVNYTVVGIFVVLLSALLLIMIFWLTAFSHTQKYKSYLLFVREDVTGLSIDSPVRFNGVQVGFVKSIHLDKNNPKLVKLSLQIQANVPITTSTFAMLNAQGITGVIYVNLKSRTVHAPLLTAKPGQKLPVIPTKPSLLMQLSTVLPEVTKDIQRLSSSIAQVLDLSNRQSIAKTLKNVENFTQSLSDNTDIIQKNLYELHKTLKNITVATKALPKTMKSVDRLSSQMTNTAKVIDSTMKRSNILISNFSDQVMPSAEQALTGIHSVTESMNSLMNQLQHNPSVLVRGKQPKQLGPGE